MDEVKEKLEVKKLPTLPVPITEKAKKNLTRLQGEYQAKRGKKISAKNLACKLLETATL